MRYFFTLLFVLLMLSVQAQRVIIGKVVDGDEHEPLPTVSARIIDQAGKIKKFASTNVNGIFRITAPDGEKLRLQLAKMSYQTMIYSLDTLNINDTLRIVMPINAVSLKEVGVQAKRIRENGDTVTYNVGAFTRGQDRSIGEVMNRMPGLEVDNSGKVQYQSTDINKLYVEGNDVTGGKYGVVTQNMQAKDVRAVEVLENHQPMQVLRGLSFSNQAAINLKLKESAKAKITAHGDAGTGYSERAHGLYTGELFTMTIKGNIQNITSFKLNNTGFALGGTNSGFYGAGGGESLAQYISIGGVGGAGHSIFNRSAAFSTSTTWKNKRGGQWRIQGDYSYDHLWSDNRTVTTYYLLEGDRIIEEDRHADSHSHGASLSANYEVNEKTYYLNNNFAFNGSWNDNDINITGTLGNRQTASTPSYDIANRLKIIKRFGEKHLVTINSTNQWLYKPQNLWVDLDNSADNGRVSSYGSNVNQSAFFTDERASYGFIMGRVVTTLEAGISAFVRHLDSGISGDMVLPDINASNDFNTNYVRIFVQPKFELNLRRFNFNFSVPVNYYHYTFGGALENRNEAFVSPNISIQWKPSQRHTINIAASARRSPASLSNILCGNILTNYRTFNAGIDDYYAFTGQTVQARWEWRNARTGWFSSLFIDQSWNQMKYGTAQTLIGDYVVNSYHAEPTNSESSTVSGFLTKSVDEINSTFKLGAAYRRGSSSVFSQGNSIDRNNWQLSISPRFDIQFCRWLNGEYSFSFSRNRLKLSDTPSNRIDTYSHMINLAATPGKWAFAVNGAHDRQRLSQGKYENRISLAASVRYNISERFQLSLNTSNLLNKRSWVSNSFSEFSSVESVSYQRGRQFLVTLRIFK